VQNQYANIVLANEKGDYDELTEHYHSQHLASLVGRPDGTSRSIYNTSIE